MADNLKNRAVKGVIWSGIEMFSVQGASFLLMLVIARFVLPTDYGLIAMLAIFLSLAQSLVDSGFTQALIQKQGRTESDFSTVFYFNLAVSVALYALLYFAAPYIAHFYDEPQLATVTRWIAPTIIITGLTVVQRAKFTISLDFKSQAKGSLIGVLCGGIAGIALACSGYGVWALVAQTLVRTSVETIMLWCFARWRPALCFSMESFKGLFSFGSKLMFSGLLHQIYLNMYTLVIGRFYSASSVGFYNRAYSLSQFPSTNITRVIARAVYPIQCQVQDDKERTVALFTQYLRMCCYLVFPLMVGLAVVAEPLIELILTDKWLPAARPLSILCFAYMWYPVMYINNQMLGVMGRSDYYLRAEVIKKIVGVVILAVTIPCGIDILCWGLVLYSIIDILIIISFSKRVIATSYLTQLRSLVPVLLVTAAMGGVTYLTLHSISAGLVVKLAASVCAGVTSYLVMSYIFKLKEISYINECLKR